MQRLLKMGPSKVLTPFLLQFRALGSSRSWSCPLPCRNLMTPSSDPSDMYTSTVQFGPPLLMLHSRPTLVSKPLIPICSIPLPPHHRPLPPQEEVFDWIIFSDLLPLNDPDTPTLLHRSSGSHSSPDISFAPSSLVFSCSWEVLQDLGSDLLPILLSVPRSPAFRPSERPPSFNFQKARWDCFASHFDSHCSSAEEYSSLSSAAALFTSLALNAAKSSIPFGRIKRQPKAW